MELDVVAMEYEADGISITRAVLLGDEDIAARMVHNVFDKKEFTDAIRMVGLLHIDRLNDKLKRMTPNDKLRGCPINEG